MNPALEICIRIQVLCDGEGEPSPNAPVNTVLPSFTGTMLIGQTLTASDGTWTNSPASYTYQWKRQGSNIASATNNTYILTEADDGYDITVTVTAINASGSGQATSAASALHEATNASRQQMWIVIGDSIAMGTSSAPGPTAAAGTVYEFDGSTVVELTTADVSTVVPGGGSPWKQYAIDYNTASGFKVVYSANGSSGSEFSPNIDNNNWSTTGTLYAPMKTKSNAGIAAIGTIRPAGILIILGINDIRGSAALGTINSDVDSLISRLNSDWPNTPIYFAQPGRSETTTNNSRMGSVRNKLRNVTKSNALSHMAIQLAPFESWGLYDTDNLHLTQPGNNKAGSLFCRYVLSGTTYSKVTRTVIGSLYDDALTPTKKAAIQTFMDKYASKLDSFSVYKTSDTNNIAVDWTAGSYGLNSGATFNIGANIATNGSTTYFRTGFFPANNTNLSSQNNMCIFVKIGTVSGTSGSLFGVTPTAQIAFQQGGSGEVFRIGDSSSHLYAGETQFQSNSLYCLVRTASNAKALFKNGTSVDTDTQASVGVANAGITLGAQGTATVPTAGTYVASQYLVFGVGAPSLINQSELDADVTTLLAVL